MAKYSLKTAAHPVSRTRLLVLTAVSAVLYVTCMIVNALGSTGDLGTATNAQMSRKYPTPITPSGWAFSIWGFIFFFQGVWTATLLVKAGALVFFKGKYFGRLEDETQGSLTVANVAATLDLWLPAAWFFEIVWTFAFNYEVIWLSLPLMYGIWVSLAGAFYRLQRLARSEYHASGPALSIPRNLHAVSRLGLTWAAIVPTAVNLGWVTVASAVNTFVVITRYGGEPGETAEDPYTPPEAEGPAGAVLLAVATLFVVLAASRFTSASLAGAVAWGMMGVHSNGDRGTDAIHAVALTSFIVLVITGVVAIVAPVSQRVLGLMSCGWSRKIDSYDTIEN